jgi:hypothetical protein
MQVPDGRIFMSDNQNSPEEDSEIVEIDNVEATRPKSVSILDKIKQTLSGTSADRWEQAGEELDSSKKYQKPQDTWEQIFCTDVKTGVLVLRCSTPVRARFFGGGYALEESGIPEYSVEVRPRGWAPKMIIDPYFRTTSGIERKLEKLAEGEIARQLYHEILLVVREYRAEVKKEFELGVERFNAEYVEQVESTGPEDWELHSTERHITKYSAEINSMAITVTRTVQENTSYHDLVLSRAGLVWECKDAKMKKAVFEIVDESYRGASLEKLGKVLEDMF